MNTKKLLSCVLLLFTVLLGSAPASRFFLPASHALLKAFTATAVVIQEKSFLLLYKLRLGYPSHMAKR